MYYSMASSDKHDDVPTIINIQNAQVKHLKGMIIIKLNDNNDSINTNPDAQTLQKPELKKNRPEALRRYYEKNKEKIIATAKKYYADNKEKRREYDKNYANDPIGRQMINERARRYYHEKKKKHKLNDNAVTDNSNQNQTVVGISDSSSD